ncbi:SAP domain-containing protein [Raphanus sativus]|uniref:Zinc finger CCCH domain-containing protein 62-like n=1 Tax=Raphanus sativus TaxID=3726 RepID=A0A9W3D569_RAPSA|nr:zinc finger CCCH domain-containing protein 62-like [Raphanus sativus]KAJ4911022.1 SAP domain-containing protein [Raphanus sativus]
MCLTSYTLVCYGSRKRFEIPKCKRLQSVPEKAWSQIIWHKSSFFIERILEHWRIRDGRGESLYPRSSFAINCKGDVCKGDIVLFTQMVHHKYEKMKGSEDIMGIRTVAGKVVKESYGTAKQQHTFTIEVLWCEGMQKLPPLYPLLVKGRNLYGLLTLRQRWANEEDRVKVLSEKHCRGAAARKVMRERKIKSGYVHKGEIRSSSWFYTSHIHF